MQHAQIGPTIFSKIFNELPVPTVVFFKKPLGNMRGKKAPKPMANFAARQLFGVQLGALTKNLFCTMADGKLHKCSLKELPWHTALKRGIGVRQDALVMTRAKNNEDAISLRAFAMPIREGRDVVAAVVTFEEVG